MRTTVDLPPDVHDRAKQLAAERGQSLSATLTELTIRGLAAMGEPAHIAINPISGFPMLSLDLGRKITAAEVAELVDEE